MVVTGANQKAYGTYYSQAVFHLGTNQAHVYLASEIRCVWVLLGYMAIVQGYILLFAFSPFSMWCFAQEERW